MKEIKGDLSNKHFFCRLNKHEMLVVDSRGFAFLLNDKAEVKRYRIDIDYSKRIMAMKLWKKHLLYFTSYEKSEKKYLNVFLFKEEDFEEYADGFTLVKDIQLKLITSLFS
jgi:hypothetical protein